MQDVRYLPLEEERAAPLLLRVGDVLIGRGSGTRAFVGRASLVQKVSEPTIFPDTAYRLRLDPERILPEWFVAVWNAPATRRAFEGRIRTTVGIWKVGWKELSEVTLAVPTLAEQADALEALRAATGRLDLALAKRDRGLRAIERYEQAMLRRAFEGRLVAATEADEDASLNLLLASPEQRAYVLRQANLENLRSVRCIVSLNHRAVKNGVQRRPGSKRKGVQLTDELEGSIETLQACATTWDYDEAAERYVFDFWIDEESRQGFGSAFDTPFDLYLALHKLALLNDLAISSPARKRFEADVRKRRFATRLPEPPEEDKVFRFEEITFHPIQRNGVGKADPVDYVSLSDGEHQLVQILGVFSMVDEPNVLFLLDEPESHLNPVWRVKFMSQLAKAPTARGAREDPNGQAAAQDVVITTHAPFVPSDLPRDQVVIFRRSEGGPQDSNQAGIRARRPDIQTFGASYDQILEQCFGVSPPISKQSQEVIGALLESKDPAEVEAGLKTLGPSVERVQVIDHLDELKKS